MTDNINKGIQRGDPFMNLKGEKVMLLNQLLRSCRSIHGVVAWLVALSLPFTVCAQLPITQLTTVYPAGGQQGTELEVQVAGGDQDSLQKMVFSHPGIVAQQKMGAADELQVKPQPVAGTFLVKIAKDVPAGIYEVRVIGHFGVSNPRCFVVGGSEEVVDNGANKEFAKPQSVKLGSIVNGRADASVTDHYQVELAAGQRVVVDCLAQRIDSRLDGTLVLFDTKGKELLRSRRYRHGDPLIDFTAPTAGQYVFGVYDFVYRGGAEYMYRLNFRSGPHIDFVLPSVGLPGTTGSFTIYGRNLPGGKPVPAQQSAGVALEQATVNIAIPNQQQLAGKRSFYQPLRAATLDAIPFQLPGSNSIDVGLAVAPVVVEKEPNAAPDKAQQITVPAQVSGQFYPARDIDWYQFAAKKGDVYVIEVTSHRRGADTDPVILVQRVTKNDKGEETIADITFVDDSANRNGLIGGDYDNSSDDPSYRLAVDQDAVYRVMVRDQFGDSRSTPQSLYELAIRSEQPDYQLLALPKQIKTANANEIKMFSPVLRRADTMLLEVRILRQDGFAGEVEVSVDGLPDQVSCQPITIAAGQNSASLVFVASESAKMWSGPIRILGKSQLDGVQRDRVARMATVVWNTANKTQAAAAYRNSQDLWLSVIEAENGVALVHVGDSQVLETSLGGKLEVPVKLVRGEGLAGDLKFVSTGVPGEVKPADLTVKAAAKEAKLAVSITNAKAKPGLYTFYLRADSKVKRPRNKSAIATAEEQQKHLDGLLKGTAEETKKVTAEKDAAVKQSQQDDQLVKTAQQKRETMAKAVAAAEAVVKQATDKRDKAQKAADQDKDNAGLAEAAKVANTELEAGNTKLTAAKKALETAQTELSQAETKAKASTEKKTTSEATFKTHTDRVKRITDAKKAADKKVADVKKANAAKDVNVAIVSTPIKLRVVASPIGIKLNAEQAQVKAAEKVQVKIALERKYGFAEPVELTLSLPKGVAGISAAKVTIAKDKNEATLEIATTEKATPGAHAVTVQAAGTFNKIKVAASGALNLTVEKPVAKP